LLRLGAIAEVGERDGGKVIDGPTTPVRLLRSRSKTQLSRPSSARRGSSRNPSRPTGELRAVAECKPYFLHRLMAPRPLPELEMGPRLDELSARHLFTSHGDDW
jgi:hypothetical protein